MLYATKAKKFGMTTIMGTLIGILMFVMGMGYWVAITGLIFGLIADLVLKSGKYQSAKRTILACGFFSMWEFGNLMPFFVGREAYLAQLQEGFGTEYVSTVSSYMPMWILPILLGATFIFGLLGGLVERRFAKNILNARGLLNEERISEQ